MPSIPLYRNEAGQLILLTFLSRKGWRIMLGKSKIDQKKRFFQENLEINRQKITIRFESCPTGTHIVNEGVLRAFCKLFYLAVIRWCSSKQVLLNISEISQESIRVGFSWRPSTLLKKDSNTGVLLWNCWNF